MFVAMRLVESNGRLIGPGQPCFVIAEAGVNHNGSLDLARRLVDAGKMAGADAIKFQTFNAERMVTAGAPKAEYQRKNTRNSESQLEMLKRLELSDSDQRELAAYCHGQGIQFISTPFDEASAALLADIGVPLFKISSGEIINLPYLAHMARYGKPMIVSTGMSNLDEVEAAVRCIEANGNPPVALLHCVSNYPAAPADVNLRAMHTLAEAFGVPVGYSDHTLGNEVALAAVALGACIIEKHLTLDRNLAGPDHQASLEPAEFLATVRGIRIVESALGSGRKQPAASEANTAAVVRRSLVIGRDLAAGTVLTPDMIAIKRPGTGLPPTLLNSVLGRRLRTAVKAGSMLSLDALD
jgi:N,N'-diacetyllegionaminate synthase